ncbi:MAG: transcription termination/antitermination protein NusG [Rhizobiaceae bacterium]
MMMADKKQQSDARRVFLDGEGRPIDTRPYLDHAEIMQGLARRQQALLAAAGEAEPARRWYVLRIMTRSEFSIDDSLERARIERWLPVCEVEGKYHGGRKGRRPAIRTVPVWPGYIFVRTANTGRAWAGLASIRGVLAVLGTAERPVPIADDKLLKLKMKLAHDEDARDIIAERVKKGERVRVTDGPFASFQGLVRWLGGFDRVKVDVNIFGRVVPVELELAQIAKL